MNKSTPLIDKLICPKHSIKNVGPEPIKISIFAGLLSSGSAKLILCGILISFRHMSNRMNSKTFNCLSEIRIYRF